MSRDGLDLGDCFQTLDTIGAATNSDNRAVGKVVNGRQGDEANYHIHPTVLDGSIQLLGAAAVNGFARKTKNWLPTSIDKINIYRCSSDMSSAVSAKLSSNLSTVGDCYCTANGKKVIEALGMKMSLADGALLSDVVNTHAAARYEWEADINLTDIVKLIRMPADRTKNLRLLDELGQLCLLSSKRQLSNSHALLPHLQKYGAWLASQPLPAVVGAASVVESLDDRIVSARIEDLVARLSNTPAAPAAISIHHVCTKMDDLFSGQSLNDVLPDGMLTNLYEFIEQSERREYVQSLSHFKPNIRILEIGTGQTSARKEILDALTRDNDEFLCSKYTFTSPGFISSRGQELTSPNMEYITLDVNQDPSEQGFEGREYDLILAANALRETKNLQQSLANLKQLLSSDGRLFLQELCPSSKWINYVLGVRSGWWLGVDDGRTGEPYVGAKEWKWQLLTAGFSEIEGMVLDAEEPYQLTTTMVARHFQLENLSVKKVTILFDERGAAVE